MRKLHRGVLGRVPISRRLRWLLVASALLASCDSAGHDSRASYTLQIEFITDGHHDAYSCGLIAGARHAALSAGVHLVVHDKPGTTWTEQGQLLTEAIQRRASAVVLDPVDYPPLIMAIRAAHDQEEKVILLDTEPDGNPGFAWSFVSADRAGIGRVAAGEIDRLIGGSGAALVIGDADRAAESPTAIGPHRYYQLTVRGSVGKEKEAVAVFLRTHPDVRAIFAADPAAVGASLQHGVPVVAADADPGLLRSGKLTAIVASPGAQVGDLAVREAVAASLYRPVPYETVEPVVLTKPVPKC